MPWTDKTHAAIEAMTADVATGRVIILTESDLKVQLCSRLRTALQGETGALTVNTESPWYDDETAGGPLFFIDVTVFDNELLHLGYIPHLERKGYRYDGPSVAIELKYCRYSADIPGVITDIEKLQIVARKANNSCFVLAMARTRSLFSEAIKLIDTAHRRPTTCGNPISVHLCAAFPAQETKTWQFQ